MSLLAADSKINAVSYVTEGSIKNKSMKTNKSFCAENSRTAAAFTQTTSFLNNLINIEISDTIDLRDKLYPFSSGETLANIEDNAINEKIKPIKIVVPPKITTISTKEYINLQNTESKRDTTVPFKLLFLNDQDVKKLENNKEELSIKQLSLEDSSVINNFTKENAKVDIINKGENITIREYSYQSASSSSSSSFPFTDRIFTSKKIYKNINKKGTSLLNHNLYTNKQSDIKASSKEQSTEPDIKPLKKKISALFIGGLSKNINETELTKLFNEYSSLISVKICRSILSDEPLGHGYLNFTDKKEALNALEKFNYTFIDGQEIRMMQSLRNPVFRKKMGTNVFFADMPLDTKNISTREFYDHFKCYGKIYSCKLDKRKNIGFIYFEDKKVAAKVIEEYNEKLFQGVAVKCGIHFNKEIRNLLNFNVKNLSTENSTVVNSSASKENSRTGLSAKKLSYEQNKRPLHPNTVYVIGLPKCFDIDMTLDLFSEVGPVKSVHTSTKYNSDYRYGFITFKKKDGCQQAIQMFNERLIKGKQIRVSKAKEKQKTEKLYLESQKNRKVSFKSNELVSKDLIMPGKIVYLSNLSKECNNVFIDELCKTNSIDLQEVQIKWFNQKTNTFAGYVVCSNNKFAEDLFNFIDGKTVGNKFVKCSWKPDNTTGLISMQPATAALLKANDKFKLIDGTSSSKKNGFNKLNPYTHTIHQKGLCRINK
ncbi:hypothetical protein QEN19_001347 [Hanseniaspora menglaensis]